MEGPQIVASVNGALYLMDWDDTEDGIATCVPFSPDHPNSIEVPTFQLLAEWTPVLMLETTWDEVND